MKNNYIIWYYNKKNNIINYTYYYETFNNTFINNIKNNEYIYIKPENLKILGLLNYKNILSYFKISSNMTKKLYHHSINFIKKIDNNFMINQKYGNHKIYYNPGGLWLSCGNSWIKYCNNNFDILNNKWLFSTYLYEVKITEKVLYINDIKEFSNFINKYKKIKIILANDTIDWIKIKNDYSGLIICPYLGDKIWGKNSNKKFYDNSVYDVTQYFNNIIGNEWKDSIKYLAEWYRHWDTASGVIWNTNGISDMRLIQKFNTFDNLDINKL